MRTKLLLFVGLAIGYVLGARAGRERYEQIRSRAEKFWTSPQVAHARHDVEAYAQRQAPVVRARVEVAAKDVAEKTAHLAKDVASTVATTAKDVADKTAATAKDVADKTAATAKDVADRVTDTAGDVKDRVTTTATDVKDRVTTTATDVKDRVTTTATDLKERGEGARERAVFKASEARDNALADLDDEDEDYEDDAEENVVR
jgi:gas vesicle protein